MGLYLNRLPKKSLSLTFIFPFHDYTERMRVTMKESGTSILFTSLTDVLAFGVGVSMTVPALRDFCFFTACAIGFDFIFQITFFPAMMIICEQQRPKLVKLEERLRQSLGQTKCCAIGVGYLKGNYLRCRIDNVENKIYKPKSLT